MVKFIEMASNVAEYIYLILIVIFFAVLILGHKYSKEKKKNHGKLINCPDCGKEISREAKMCPNCGKPKKGQTSSSVPFGCSTVILGLIVMLIFSPILGELFIVIGIVLFVVGVVKRSL